MRDIVMYREIVAFIVTALAVPFLFAVLLPVTPSDRGATIQNEGEGSSPWQGRLAQ
jgi:hypothetical protein